MILDGKKIAEEIIARLRDDVAALRSREVVPGLGIVLIGDDPSSQLYVSMKQKTAEDLGMKCTLLELSSNVSEGAALKAIESMSVDTSLHGIIIQLPIPAHLSRETICSAIPLSKDIDCLSPESLKNLEDGDISTRPPTAESVARLIAISGESIVGKKIAVIGSGFFSRQIAAHLRNVGARVEQIPFRSDDLLEKARGADILVTAVGRPACIDARMVKEGAVIIDVGVTRQDGDVVGDVAFDEVSKKAAAITPVPGGVGPVTVACLLENVVKAARMQLTSG